MKRNKIKMAFTLFAVLLCLNGCISLPEETTDPTASGTVIPPDRIESVLRRYQNTVYTYATCVDQTLLTTGHSTKYLLLMNKQHALGEAYFPDSLSVLTCRTHYDEELKMESGAAAALEAMFSEMEADGVTDISVTSAYRSYQYQTRLFEKYVHYEQTTISEDAIQVLGMPYLQSAYLDRGVKGLTEEDAIKVVESYSAPPGKSEHQTGLCADFITSGMNDQLTAEFENTAAFEWLSENAYRFGFILRYPKDKESVTGYQYEPWHYRFVGREAATNIHFSGLTLEEYLTFWQTQ